MSQPNVIKLNAVVNDGEFSVEKLRISVAVNNVPTAALTVARKTAGIVHKPMSKEVIDSIRERQQKRLAGRTAPDITIDASDGNGGNLHFTGYMAAPVLEISTSSVSDQFTVVGVDAALDGLDLSIYLAGATGERAKENRDGLDPIPSASSGDVPKMLSEITEVLVANYEFSLEMEQQDIMVRLLEIQHEINTDAPLDLWREILKGSDAVYESWAAGVAQCDAIADALAERAMNMLCQKTSGFWQVVNGLMSSYQLFYKPNTDTSGKLLLASKKVGEPQGSVDISTTVVNVSDGSSRILQPGGVVMISGSTPGARAAENYTPPSIVAMYPDPLLKGYIHRESPPAWMVDDAGISVLGSEVDKTADDEEESTTVNLSLDDHQARTTSGDAQQEKVRGVSTGMMTELCKVMFEDLQLADSTASFSIPLNFNVEVGTRTTFTTGDGGTFTGFVAGLSHNLDLRQGKELDSFTQLSITHIRY